MKLANRIFLFFSALSVISFVQFDAMGLDGCNSVDAGRYCLKKNDKYACPAGCWCEKKTKVSAVADISDLPSDRAVKYACATKDPSKKEQLEARGVHYCPYGTTSSNNGTIGAKEETDCKNGETAYDGSNNCTSETSGRYCSSKGTQHDCPKGCYCTGSKNAVGEQWWNSNSGNSGAWETIPVTSWCNNNSRWLEEYLAKRGIHYCPKDFPNSDKKESSEEKCYFETNDNRKVYADEVVTAKQGYFLPQSSVTGSLCRAGSYCPGGGLHPSAQKDVGIYQCPAGYRDGGAGAKSKHECENLRGEKYYSDGSVSREVITRCPAGQYLDTTRTISKAICVQCDAGYYCPGDDEKHWCTGPREYSTAGALACSTCLVGQLANSTHTGCEAMTINMGSTDVAAQRVDVSDLVAFDPTCLNGDPSHKVYFLGGAGNATGTMNPVNKCTGDTVTLPSSGFTRAGYQFDKWNCDNNNIGTKAAGATFTMPNADVNCTAQWTPVPVGTYTVSYTCGDGTGSAPVDNGSYAHNDSVTVKSNTCTAPSGKTFDKWSCNGTVVTPGNQFTITENTTCKAQWKNDTDQTVHCPQGGKYWNGNGCADCPMGAYCPVNDDERHECENNTYSNTTGNAVCTACPVGETAINNHTDCTSNQTVTCGEGKYLPAGSSNCVQCPDGYGCSGGTFEIKNFNQGREQCMPDRVSCQNYSACCYCPDGSNPNDTYSGCVNSNGTVVLPEDPDDSCTTAGEYWDGDGCITCESGYFCPGNGQHYKCPFGGASTQNKASCVLNLNETQMEYNKCWLRYWNNAAAYRKCLYGIDLATLLH